jgi:hypothetical protein
MSIARSGFLLLKAVILKRAAEGVVWVGARKRVARRSLGVVGKDLPSHGTKLYTKHAQQPPFEKSKRSEKFETSEKLKGWRGSRLKA